MDTTDRATAGTSAETAPPTHARAPGHSSSVCAEGDAGFTERYRAISARDVRFDGQFVTGVTSTGIYCRPSCPAVTPKPGNVVFLLTSAAAHEAGFRACRRCLPEAVPGTPAWNLRGDAAARAMRLISDGVVDREGVPGLAGRLGFTTRHLTRLLTAELGASPLALTRAHRAQTARTLMTGTDLPLADVAFAAGFGSVRQFNDTIRTVFDATPRQLRARRRPRPQPVGDTHPDVVSPSPPTEASAPPRDSVPAGTLPAPDVRLDVALPVRAPFDAPGIFAFLAARAIAGVEAADLSDPTHLHFARTLALPHGPAVAEVVAASHSPDTSHSPGTSRATATASSPAPSPQPAWTLRARLTLTALADAPTAIARLRRLFDLDADPFAIDEALAADPLLTPLVTAAPGARVSGAVDAHELVIRAVVGQQISVAAARTHLSRLTARAGTAVRTHVPELTHLFPSAAQIACTVSPVPAGTSLDPDRPLRLPRRALATVHHLAADLASGALDLHIGLDSAALQHTLLTRSGIGPWTAAYTAMRVLGDPDIWLPGDAALAAAARRLRHTGDLSPDDLDARSVRWSPWRSYAVVRLWASAAPAPTGPRQTARKDSP